MISIIPYHPSFVLSTAGNAFVKKEGEGATHGTLRGIPMNPLPDDDILLFILDPL